AADERRRAQIGEEEVSRERTRMGTNEEEEFATEGHGRALIEGKNSTTEDTEGAEAAEEFATYEHGRAQTGDENSEAIEGGMNELSPLNGGMETTGEGHQEEEFTATDAKSAKQNEQDRTPEVAENAEK